MKKSERLLRLSKVVLYGLLVHVITFLFSCSKAHTVLLDEPTLDENSIVVDLVVAADGTGDYSSDQQAINAAPANRQQYFFIDIKKEVYKEAVTVPKGKDFIYLIGESAENTVLTFDNYAQRLRDDGTEFGKGGSSGFFVNGNNFVSENLTFSNTACITAGQALSINITVQKSSFQGCCFFGYQDTWYAGNATYQYLKDCYNEGSVDFMFGGSVACFDKYELKRTRNGYLTAASTPAQQSFGYIFSQCNINAYPTVGDGSVYLGRPWRHNAKVVYLECVMDSHINKSGWNDGGNSANEKTVFYAEYNSSGPGTSPATRVNWSRQLTQSEDRDFLFDRVIDKSHPSFIDENKIIKIHYI